MRQRAVPRFKELDQLECPAARSHTTDNAALSIHNNSRHTEKMLWDWLTDNIKLIWSDMIKQMVDKVELVIAASLLCVRRQGERPIDQAIIIGFKVCVSIFLQELIITSVSIDYKVHLNTNKRKNLFITIC